MDIARTMINRKIKVLIILSIPTSFYIEDSLRHAAGNSLAVTVHGLCGTKKRTILVRFFVFVSNWLKSI